MPLLHCISPISAFCTPPERYNTLQKYDPHQQHSTISQDPNVIAFSTESPTTLPMTDYNKHAINAQDLTSRLRSLQQTTFNANTTANNTNNINGETSPYPTMSQRRARPSVDSTSMPRITKSATTSTTCTASTNSSRYTTTSNLRASPSARTHPESVGVAPGDFSKPRVHRRSRRVSSEPPDVIPFKYYGRHSNQWLFNDFSVTDAVSKGWRKVFGRDEGGRDWYEDRGR
ncbi:hypothetical protein Ptr902_04780 [Pyrenophora tritici-repentis]|nr:hypothetical protein TUN199_02965 [Pyrenophora tritici-repentis]KAI2485840.1 hypothetical protein Ptr902_04780 [Pyrenophora tritici-repentis]